MITQKRNVFDTAVIAQKNWLSRSSVQYNTVLLKKPMNTSE